MRGANQAQFSSSKQHRLQAATANIAAPEIYETKFLKSLEQKTNLFLKAHNSRERVVGSGAGG